MNFQQLRFVLTVAETRSFTSAADICCVTQPALSNAIAQLEEELGAKLFERTTRSVGLTPFGDSMIDPIRKVIAARTDLLQHSADYLARNDHVIKLGLSPLVSDDCVAAVLARIAVMDRNLTVILSEMNKADIQPALDSGEIGFGLVPEPMIQTDTRTASVYREPLLFISDDAPGSRGDSARLSEIIGKQVLMVGDDCGLSEAVRNLARDNQLSLPEYGGKALGYGVLEKWALLGIGVAILPASKVADMTRARGLVDAQGATVSIGFCACWKPSQELRPSFPLILKALLSG